MKKVFSLLLAAAMVLTLAACAGKPAQTTATTTEPTTAPTTAPTTEATTEPTVKESTHIYVLTAAEDHGWTGSVATFAKEKVAEINAGGKYTAEVITASSAADQIAQVEDIVASGKKNIAVVIQPQDDTLESAIAQLAKAGIPFTAFDRIIGGVASSAIANVKGDNAGIGAGAAAYFVSLGLTPGEKVYVYQGDTSSVSKLRDQGFTDYLTGKASYEGKTISEDKKWTEEQLSSISFSGAMSWSRSNTKTAFESLLGDANNADIKWFYAEDDELAMGILEALQGGGIEDATKAAFLANKPVITGCGGLDELYEILRGNAYQELYQQLGGFISVTYSPSMIQTTIQDLVDYLDGKTVPQDHVIACEQVTAQNVGNYQSFK